MGKKNKFFRTLCSIGMCFLLVLTAIPTNIFAVAEDSNVIETIIDDNATGTDLNQVNYQGEWVGEANAACYNNTDHYTTPRLPGVDWATSKPSLSIKFKGTKIELYGQKHDGVGIYSISIDGGTAVEVDVYSQEAKNQQLIYASETLSDAEHVITMAMTGKKNSSSRNPDGQFDFAKVYTPASSATGISITSPDFSLTAGDNKTLSATVTPVGAVTDGIVWSSSDSSVASVNDSGVVLAHKNGTAKISAKIKNTEITSNEVAVIVTGNDIANDVDLVDDNAASEIGLKFTYENTWGVDTGYAPCFRGTNHYSTSGGATKNQASAHLVFYGKGIEVYGNKDRGNGIYAIYIDDEWMGTFDAYNAGGRIFQQKIYENKNLEEGEHTLRIESTEEKNAASSGFEMALDYAKVYRDTVDINATDITLSHKEMQVDLGTEMSLNATYAPVYATNKTAAWSTSDDSVIGVDNTGKITAKKVGKASITGTLPNGKTASVNITVVSSDYTIRAMFGNSNIHYLQSEYEEILKKYGTESQLYNSSFGWKGDTINAEVVAWTKNEAVSNLKVNTTNFTNEAGDVFSKDNVSIKFLKTTSVSKGRAGSSYTAPHDDIPDIIYGGEVATLAKKSIQNAWMSISIPKDAKPGVYHGTISVSADEMDMPIVLPYTFEVLDLSQPEKADYKGGVEIWEYPYAVAKYYNISDEDLYGEKHIKLLEKNVKEYAAVGGTVITTAITDYPWDRNNPYDYPSTIKWTKELDGTFSFDYSQFDAWVQLNVDNGIKDKLKCFSMSSYYGSSAGVKKMRYFDKATGQYQEERGINVGSARWHEVWGQFMESFVPHLDEKGWFDMTYTAMDEVGGDTINAVADLVEKYPNKDGHTMKVSAAVNYGGTNQATLDRIHDISIALSHVDSSMREVAADRRAKGLYTSFYTCTGIYPNSFAPNNPGESAWTMWYQGADDMDGYLRWAGDNWLKEPYKNLDWSSWESGDTMLFYPDDNKNAEDPMLRSTPRWEKMKEGKRDIEKMYYLRDNYPQLADEITELLHGIGRKNGAVNLYGGMYADSKETEVFIENEVQRMRTGLKEFSKEALTSAPVEGLEELRAAITAAEAFVSASDETNYTSASWNLYKVAIQEAKVLLDKADVTAAEIDAAGESLATKKAGLVSLEEIKAVIRAAKELKAEDYSAESFAKLTSAIAKAEGLFAQGTAAEIMSAKAAIEDAVANLEAKANVAKDILTSAIHKAMSIKESGVLEGLAEKVVANFNKRLDEAVAVLGNAAATPEEMMEAWLALAEAMHYLDFTADKTQLKALIAECDLIDLGEYQEAGKAEFAAALANAKEVAASDEVLDASITKAFDRLTSAKSNLKPIDKLNKTLLSYFIQKGEEAKAKQDYYEQDAKWNTFIKALNDAKIALETAKTQKAIDDAAAALASAYEDIRLIANEDRLQEISDFTKMIRSLSTTNYREADYQKMQVALDYANELLKKGEFTKPEFEKFEAMKAEAEKVAKENIVTQPADVTKIPTENNSVGTGDATNTAILWGAIIGAAAIVLGTNYRKGKSA